MVVPSWKLYNINSRHQQALSYVHNQRIFFFYCISIKAGTFLHAVKIILISVLLACFSGEWVVTKEWFEEMDCILLITSNLIANKIWGCKSWRSFSSSLPSACSRTFFRWGIIWTVTIRHTYTWLTSKTRCCFHIPVCLWMKCDSVSFSKPSLAQHLPCISSSMECWRCLVFLRTVQGAPKSPSLAKS